MRRLSALLLLLGAVISCNRYENPVLYADYSDPDVVEALGSYWMTSSSFNCSPALQVLRSQNLVDWEYVGSALRGPEVYWNEAAGKPIVNLGPGSAPEGSVFPSRPLPGSPIQHGCGVWAPSIRYHDGLFWIFWGDPDYGIYQVHTDDPTSDWSEPQCVIPGRGFIDPCPLWDEDGRVWLVHAWANSRCGLKSVLHVCELDSLCTRRIGPETLVFDGRENGNTTVEGPKFYKRDGWYWIMAPAGGVKTGWQLAMRSRSVLGPYEHRIVMEQGGTDICGPHQGGWVEDAKGRGWFMHFEDRYAWGRVVHLQPLEWTADGWPVIGEDEDGDGTGNPVSILPRRSRMASSSETEDWKYQWQADPEEYKADTIRNLWDANLLLRKIEGPRMETVVRVDPEDIGEGVRNGLVVMGADYATVELRRIGGGINVNARWCLDAEKGAEESLIVSLFPEVEGPVWLKVVVYEGDFRGKTSSDIPAICDFYYSIDGTEFEGILGPFQARAGKWIGAKVGAFKIAE